METGQDKFCSGNNWGESDDYKNLDEENTLRYIRRLPSIEELDEELNETKPR